MSDDVIVEFDDSDEMEPNLNYCVHPRHEKDRRSVGKYSQRATSMNL